MQGIGSQRSSIWLALTGLALFILVVLAIRKPVLIVYHQNRMVSTWQAHVGLPQSRGWFASYLEDFGLVPALPKRSSDPTAMRRVFQHRAALVRLGYLTERRFPLSPVEVGSPEYGELCARVAAETGQQPTAQFEVDNPTAPSLDFHGPEFA
jgi:hypothetical protein